MPAGHARSAQIQAARGQHVFRRRTIRPPIPPPRSRVTNSTTPTRFTPGPTTAILPNRFPIRSPCRCCGAEQERFDIFCSPCHGRLGNGDGMVARRGFHAPADLNSDRVRQEPPGYLFQVITNGYGAMPDYGDQIPADDRWAIVAYLRALELSRGAPVADVPPATESRTGGNSHDTVVRDSARAWQRHCGAGRHASSPAACYCWWSP